MKYQDIIRDLKNKVYHPVYFLGGTEEYFIDQIANYIENHVLDEAEKEFNQSILYGLETDDLTIVSEAKRFPMMSNYNVVIVKEAQYLKQVDQLTAYIENPSPTTILAFCYKHKKPDGRKAYIKAIKKSAVYFESKKLYENQIAPWLESKIKEEGYEIDPKAILLFVESVGTDLSHLNNELGKMLLNLKPGTKITADHVANNIGISKEFNVFELNDALAKREVLKANRIINHFGANPKTYAIPALIPQMYKFFAQLLLFETVKHAPARDAASKLGVNPFFLKDFQIASKNYNRKKIAKIMSSLHKADLRSKGIGATNMTSHDILKELVFEILH